MKDPCGQSATSAQSVDPNDETVLQIVYNGPYNAPRQQLTLARYT